MCTLRAVYQAAQFARNEPVLLLLGDTIYRSKEEVAAMLGVDRIYVTDKAIGVVCFIPEEYWVKEKAALQVSYPRYENNVMNYQRERNIGGAVHGLKSVAFGVTE